VVNFDPFINLNSLLKQCDYSHGFVSIANGLLIGDNEQTSDPYIKFFGPLNLISLGYEKTFDETTIMSLNGVSVTINGKTITNAFQMASNAGLGKILACDQAGNGIWAEASLFNDMDWLEPREDEKEKGKSDMLYSNPKSLAF
jgi:hypothetical protein